MIKIYTDGAASMNFVNGEYQRGNGGSAMAIINDKEEIEYSASKHFDNTTNNYCELYAISKHFNYFRYYNWLKEISKKYPVFVSEQYLPPEFDKNIIWRKDVNRTCGKDHQFKACETLWLIDNRSQV